MVEHVLLEKLASRFYGKKWAELSYLEQDLAEILIRAGYLHKLKSGVLAKPK